MKKTHPFNIIAKAVGILTIGLLLSKVNVQGQTEADAAFSAYNQDFLVQNGSTAYYVYDTNSTTQAGSGNWGLALKIMVAEDAYNRTRSPATQTLVANLLNTYLVTNNNSLGGDGWNDNAGWEIIAFIRGYQITGITNFLNVAATAWNSTYTSGWDTTYGGGGIWENMGDLQPNGSGVYDGKAGKCALSCDSMLIGGCELYQSTGDATYLTKCEAIYSWVRANLFIPSTGVVNEGMAYPLYPATTPQAEAGSLIVSDNLYNGGAFLECADLLYRATGNTSYYNDAVIVANHWAQNTSFPILGSPNYTYEGHYYVPSELAGNQWEYWFVKGLSDFCNDAPSLWPQYYPWLLNNANAAWSMRSTQAIAPNVTWSDWTHVTDWTKLPTGYYPSPLVCSSAAAVWQVLPVPLWSGNFEMQVTSSGMAVNVAGAATVNGAAIVQTPYSGATSSVWTLVPSGHGYFEIKNVNSGLALVVQNASTLAGASVIQWSFGSSTGNDQWWPVENSDGTCSFVNRHSGLFLELPGSSFQPSVQFDQNVSSGAANQKFTLTQNPGASLNLANGTYEIQGVNDALAVNVQYGSTSNGGNIIQWPFHGGSSSLWTFVPESNGYYQIKNVNSGLALAVQNASTATGALAVQWTFGSSTNDDQWLPVLNPDGTYSFTNRNSGLTLEMPNSSSQEGAQFDQNAASGGSNQKFNLVQNPSASLNLANGSYEIQSEGNALAIGIATAATTNGAALIQSYFDGGPNSLWSFISTDSGYYQIQNVNSGLVLAVQNASISPGAPVLQWQFGSSTDNDQWMPQVSANGSYVFLNRHSGLVLDIPGGSATPGQQLDQYGASGGTSQAFNLIPVP